MTFASNSDRFGSVFSLHWLRRSQERPSVANYLSRCQYHRSTSSYCSQNWSFFLAIQTPLTTEKRWSLLFSQWLSYWASIWLPDSSIYLRSSCCLELEAHCYWAQRFRELFLIFLSLLWPFTRPQKSERTTLLGAFTIGSSWSKRKEYAYSSCLPWERNHRIEERGDSSIIGYLIRHE
jgi:hypothetical protein